LGDFVVLFCWRLSRKPPSERYPYGFAKFETLGTTTISILLIGGALGIGFHSYHLLLLALADSAHHLSPGPLQEALLWITSHGSLPEIGHAHEHGLDPNAMWFALIGVASKEWLYRITKVVADEEKSPVLLANAIHHRSDAYSSLVAFFAILGSWLFPAFPLDPIGGMYPLCTT
jgi:divalent metal cation (Fe/Co/Zn/Cd) transporter